MTVKEFEKPDASGHRLYTVHAVDIEGTPASIRATRRLGFPNTSIHSHAGVGTRFAQMVEIVNQG